MIRNPELIDSYKYVTKEFVDLNNQSSWFIAKPEMNNNILERIYHAVLVLIGKATAVRFYEDLK